MFPMNQNNKEHYSTMDQSSGGLGDVVKEIQSSNRFILKRLNQLFLSSGDETCTCSCKKDIGECKNEFERLQSKLGQLEPLVKQFNNRMNAMEQRMETFDSTLMSMQTDDSKLRQSLRKELLVQDDNESATVKHSDIKTEVRKEIVENGDNVKTYGDSGASKKAGDHQAQSDQKGYDQGKKLDNGAEGGDSIANSTANISEESERIRLMNERNKEMCSGGAVKTEAGVEVVEQTVVQGHDDENFWRYLAHREVEDGKETLRDLEGVHSIVCLDISASMTKGSSWREAKTFVTDYLNGLEEVSNRYGLSDEHVALVTFGHETKVQRRLTNKYSELRKAIDTIRLGGPSPLYGGMVLALAAGASSVHQIQRVGSAVVFTKIIIITDGHLTDQRMFAGPDVLARDVDKAKAKILEAVEEYKSDHIDMFLLPVGQADTAFLELMASNGDGTMLDSKEGRQLARRTYVASKMVDPLGLMPFLQDSGKLSAEDKKTMDSIREKARKIIEFPLGRLKEDMYNEVKDGDYPPIGSRVRRGPDWGWNEQDSHGPGTVIGHDKDAQVWVEWDANEHQNIYRYGGSGYDVLIVDQPRKLKSGEEIAVGCVVRPGKDLPEFRPTDKGAVIKLDKAKRKATIRWNNGKRSKNSYGKSDKQEIIVCSGVQPFETQGYVLGSTMTPEPERPEEKQKPEEMQNPEEKQTKNKNKNAHF